MLLDRGDTAKTDEHLASLDDMMLEAEDDVREYILGAKIFHVPGVPFFEALRRYVERFGQQYAVRSVLEVPGELERQGLDRATETQLLRIVQEALSNTRKHARARSCRVEFSVCGRQLQVAVADDGQGFDLEAAAGRYGERFGLYAMRERAESLGGVLTVASQPGKGTLVVVRMPFRQEEEVEADV